MQKPRSTCLALAFSLALLLPATSDAVAPALLFMIKQIAQQTATSMLKDALLSGLSGMGCKGIALSNAIAAVELRKGGVVGATATAMPTLPVGVSMPNLGTMTGIGAVNGIGPIAGMPPEMAAKMSSFMPGLGQLPAGMALDPEQAEMMARMQQSMGQPLSPPETLRVIDDLFELGFLPKPIQAEFKECMVLVPASVPALGMGMGMMKPMIPQLRQARDELRALSPQEQDEVAAVLAQEVRPLPAEQRAAFVEHLDSGFFPPRVAASVRRRLAAP